MTDYARCDLRCILEPEGVTHYAACVNFGSERSASVSAAPAVTEQTGEALRGERLLAKLCALRDDPSPKSMHPVDAHRAALNAAIALVASSSVEFGES